MESTHGDDAVAMHTYCSTSNLSGSFPGEHVKLLAQEPGVFNVAVALRSRIELNEFR